MPTNAIGLMSAAKYCAVICAPTNKTPINDEIKFQSNNNLLLLLTTIYNTIYEKKIFSPEMRIYRAIVSVKLNPALSDKNIKCAIIIFKHFNIISKTKFLLFLLSN